MRYLIIPACHFDGWELCKAAVIRLQIALNIARRDDQIVVTGNVPRIAGCPPTLAELMQDWLIKMRFPANRVSKLLEGVGTFSEARAACGLFGNKEVVIVSSSWYLFAGKQIWQRRARENNINISFVSVPNTGGWRTFVTYFLYGLVIRAGITVGLEKPLEETMTASQQKRLEGFTFNGCR